MANANLLFRRAHLYLGLLLIPWTLIYALSTVLFNHAGHLRSWRATGPQWLPLWEKAYALDVPAGNDALRAAAARLLADHGLQGPYAVQRQGQRLNINVQNLQAPVRLVYEIGERKLRAEKRNSTWADVLVRLHERTGYGSAGLLYNLWAVIVDVFCVAMLAWIGTGLYLWWKLPMVRGWGWAALGAGGASLLVLLATL